MKSGLSLWLWEDEVTLNEGDFRRHGAVCPGCRPTGSPNSPTLRTNDMNVHLGYLTFKERIHVHG